MWIVLGVQRVENGPLNTNQIEHSFDGFDTNYDYFNRQFGFDFINCLKFKAPHAKIIGSVTLWLTHNLNFLQHDWFMKSKRIVWDRSTLLVLKIWSKDLGCFFSYYTESCVTGLIKVVLFHISNPICKSNWCCLNWSVIVICLCVCAETHSYVTKNFMWEKSNASSRYLCAHALMP